MYFDTLLASFGSVATPAAFLAHAPGSAEEMLRVVLFLAAIVGCGSTVVAWLSRDGA